MRSISALAVGLALILVLAPASADVVDAVCSTDGDGAVELGDWTWSWDGAANMAYMNVPEAQVWAPGHIFPGFVTDQPGDPSALVTKLVNNDTTFDWTDYHINISSENEFSIDDATSPTGWLDPVITPVTLQGSTYVGAVDYFYGGPGTEILIGDMGEFAVLLNFTDTIMFTMEQIPTPEPASVSLLLLGAAVLLRRR